MGIKKKAGISSLVTLVMLIIIMILLYYLVINEFNFPVAVQDMLGLFGQAKPK